MSIGSFYATIFGFREFQISRLGIQLYVHLIFRFQIITFFFLHRFRHIDAFYKIPDILEVLGVDGFVTFYIFILALPVACALFGMSCCHGHMISQDRTLVESLVNEKSDDSLTSNQKTRMGNWKQFLGVNTPYEFIRRNLFPSTHRPKGNGITTTNYCDGDVNLLSNHDEHGSYASNIYNRISDNYLVKKYHSELSVWNKPQVLSREWRSIVQTC